MDTKNTDKPQDNEMEIRLWEYIDGNLNSEERSIVGRLIAEKREWRAKYNELLELHQLVQQTELEQPSLRFTKNVMDEISKLHIAPATKNYINNKVIWGIAIFFITVIVSFLIYGISQINWSTGNTSSSVGGVDFTKVDYSRMFNNTYLNVFMMLNILMGLMLLDRFLAGKRKRYMEEA